LEEQIYMKQLEGFVVQGKKELVFKLQRFLYAPKKSPRMWYQNFDTYILSFGFVIGKDDHCVYSNEEDDHFIYVYFYFNMLLVRNNMDAIKKVKKQLSYNFNMKEICAADFILLQNEIHH
jgi:hypothetical protein